MTRHGPKVIVGEYAATTASPTGTMSGALGEAAFLTGIERNADLVIGASYAPLLTNVNEPNWYTNLIGYNGLTSFVSPSYWVLKMFSANHGRRLIASRLTGGSGKLFEVASRGPRHRYVLLVNDSGVTRQRQADRHTQRCARRHRHDLGGQAEQCQYTVQSKRRRSRRPSPSQAGLPVALVLPADSVTAVNLRSS